MPIDDGGLVEPIYSGPDNHAAWCKRTHGDGFCIDEILRHAFKAPDHEYRTITPFAVLTTRRARLRWWWRRTWDRVRNGPDE